MSLNQQIRQILAELELISHGATVRFDPSTSHGHAGSSAPTGDSNPPHIRFRTRFDECRTNRDREITLDAAREELRSLKVRTAPAAGVSGLELLRRQVLEDHVGSTSADVAVALYCTTSKVRNIRTEAGCDPETGLEMVVLDESDRERARRYAAQGMTERQIARFLGKGTSTVRRLLDRAA